MDQLAFTFSPLARKSDVQTSHDAAKKAEKFKLKHEERIFNALYEASAQNLTYRQIAEVTGMEPVAVARRLRGMERKGTIKRWTSPDGEFESRNGMCVWRVA